MAPPPLDPRKKGPLIFIKLLLGSPPCQNPKYATVHSYIRT